MRDLAAQGAWLTVDSGVVHQVTGRAKVVVVSLISKVTKESVSSRQ